MITTQDLDVAAKYAIDTAIRTGSSQSSEARTAQQRYDALRQQFYDEWHASGKSYTEYTNPPAPTTTVPVAAPTTTTAPTTPPETPTTVRLKVATDISNQLVAAGFGGYWSPAMVEAQLFHEGPLRYAPHASGFKITGAGVATITGPGGVMTVNLADFNAGMKDYEVSYAKHNLDQIAQITSVVLKAMGQQNIAKQEAESALARRAALGSGGLVSGGFLTGGDVINVPVRALTPTPLKIVVGSIGLAAFTGGVSGAIFGEITRDIITSTTILRSPALFAIATSSTTATIGTMAMAHGMTPVAEQAKVAIESKDITQIVATFGSIVAGTITSGMGYKYTMAGERVLPIRIEELQVGDETYWKGLTAWNKTVIGLKYGGEKTRLTVGNIFPEYGEMLYAKGATIPANLPAFQAHAVTEGLKPFMTKADYAGMRDYIAKVGEFRTVPSKIVGSVEATFSETAAKAGLTESDIQAWLKLTKDTTSATQRILARNFEVFGSTAKRVQWIEGILGKLNLPTDVEELAIAFGDIDQQFRTVGGMQRYVRTLQTGLGDVLTYRTPKDIVLNIGDALPRDAVKVTVGATGERFLDIHSLESSYGTPEYAWGYSKAGYPSVKTGIINVQRFAGLAQEMVAGLSTTEINIGEGMVEFAANIGRLKDTARNILTLTSQSVTKYGYEAGVEYVKPTVNYLVGLLGKAGLTPPQISGLVVETAFTPSGFVFPEQPSYTGASIMALSIGAVSYPSISSISRSISASVSSMSKSASSILPSMPRYLYPSISPPSYNPPSISPPSISPPSISPLSLSPPSISPPSYSPPTYTPPPYSPPYIPPFKSSVYMFFPKKRGAKRGGKKYGERLWYVGPLMPKLPKLASPGKMFKMPKATIPKMVKVKLPKMKAIKMPTMKVPRMKKMRRMV